MGAKRQVLGHDNSEFQPQKCLVQFAKMPLPRMCGKLLLRHCGRYFSRHCGRDPQSMGETHASRKH